MSTSFDTIVIGLGAMGSATCFHLARRGARVLGLDAYTPGHTNGSSHGQSRIIRKAYLEGSGYVPLVLRAYELWDELAHESGKRLFTTTGGLMIGQPESEAVAGALFSAKAHGLPFEYLNAVEVTKRFPGFRPAETMMAVYEPEAGSLNPERCISAHLSLAQAAGATLRHAEPVRSWSFGGGGVRVETDQGVYAGDRVVITAGPWASGLLSQLDLPLVVWRTFVTHFEPLVPAAYAPGACPVYIWEVPEGTYYGFPALPGQGVKVGRHDTGEVTTPATIRRETDDADVAVLRAFLDRYMPGASGAVRQSLTCMYTNTPDRHFLIDHHPESDRVVYACGFSGHGFKFSSVVGEVMADLATLGTTDHDIAFLSAQRFASLTRG